MSNYIMADLVQRPNTKQDFEFTLQCNKCTETFIDTANIIGFYFHFALRFNLFNKLKIVAIKSKQIFGTAPMCLAIKRTCIQTYGYALSLF